MQFFYSATTQDLLIKEASKVIYRYRVARVQLALIASKWNDKWVYTYLFYNHRLPGWLWFSVSLYPFLFISLPSPKSDRSFFLEQSSTYQYWSPMLLWIKISHHQAFYKSISSRDKAWSLLSIGATTVMPVFQLKNTLSDHY